MKFFTISLIASSLCFMFTMNSCRQCMDSCEQGVCIKGVCNCNLWYEGDACDRSVLYDFQGKYEGKIRLDSAYAPIAFHLLQEGTDPSLLLFDTLGLRLNFVTDTRFTLSDSDTSEWVVSGDGEMIIGGLSMHVVRTSIDSIQEFNIAAQQQ